MADLHARTEQTKVEFLEAELKECFTFINIAETEHSLGEQAAAEKAIASAEDGYAAIRRFLADIEHGEKRRDLQSNLVKTTRSPRQFEAYECFTTRSPKLTLFPSRPT